MCNWFLLLESVDGTVDSRLPKGLRSIHIVPFEGNLVQSADSKGAYTGCDQATRSLKIIKRHSVNLEKGFPFLPFDRTSGLGRSRPRTGSIRRSKPAWDSFEEGKTVVCPRTGSIRRNKPAWDSFEELTVVPLLCVPTRTHWVIGTHWVVGSS